MNSAHDQPSTPSVPSALPTPPIPTAPPPTTQNPQPPTPNSQPTTYSPPPTTNYPSPPAGGPPPTNHGSKKFPFMIVTIFLAVVIAGLASSYLFFSFNSSNPKVRPTQVLITPPVAFTSPSPTIVANPFDASDLTVNPFASSSSPAANPFGTYQNPFTNAASASGTSQPYQNPFADQK